ncbi:MAG: cupin domain-containing protein [Candidatus Lokiarchaeota archaeon]
MIKKNYKEVKEEIVTKADSKKTTIRWLITKQDGSERYATRRFEIEPGGEIGLHDHPWEHHIYVLQGNADFVNNEGKVFTANKDDVIFIPPNEVHSMQNKSNETFIFLCVIPYLD